MYINQVANMSLWNIFGSPSSHDYDIFVMINTATKPDKAHLGLKLCRDYEKLLANEFPQDKPLNVNVGYVENGVVVWSAKGTADETNNALFVTYIYHDQKHPQIITQSVERNINAKLLRTARTLLGLISRTNERVLVKTALNTDSLGSRVTTLEKIDYETLRWTNKPQDPIPTIWKNIAFQIGQTLALIEKNIELYSKESIGEQYPELQVFLQRREFTENDLKALTTIKNRLVELYKIRIAENPDLANCAENLY
jgi:hypothetical protein